MAHEAVLRQQAVPATAVDGAADGSALSAGRRVGLVTALPDDGECLRALGATAALMIATSDGDAERARARAQALVDGGVAGLLSFGPAIGLAPILRPGDLVVADSVVLPSGEAVGTDQAWRERLVGRLSARGIELRVARIAGRDRLLTSLAQRQRAFQATFAAALDTESHAVAEVASAAGLPFLVVRAVADPVEESRPAATIGACARDDQRGAIHIVARCVLRPWQIPAAWRFNQNGKMALEALRQVATIGPESFAF